VKLAHAGAAAGARAAAPTDVLDRARTVVDDRVDVAIRGWVTEADDHGEFDNAFQNRKRQGAEMWQASPWIY